MEESMRKTLMLIVAAAALTTWSVAQDQDNSAKQDMKNAGSSTANAAKSVGKGVKKGAVGTKNAVTGQNPSSDTAGEKNLPDSVDIVGTPNANPKKNSATITWQTNKTAASDVWLEGGGIRGHRTGYERGGSKNHTVTFSNLKPNTTYNYKIRSRKGQVRYEGSFTTKS